MHQLFWAFQRQHYDRATCRSVEWAANLPAVLPHPPYQIVGEEARALADALDTDLQHDIQRGACRIYRCHRRRSRFETRRIFAELELGGAELKLIASAPPARDRRAQPRDKLFTHIDECDAGSAHQPL